MTDRGSIRRDAIYNELLALTQDGDAAMALRRYARLVLLLADTVDDPERVIRIMRMAADESR